MKNNSPLNRKMRLAFGSAILTLLVVGVSPCHAVAVSGESDRCVRHIKQVIANLFTLCLKPRRDSL